MGSPTRGHTEMKEDEKVDGNDELGDEPTGFETEVDVH